MFGGHFLYVHLIGLTDNQDSWLSFVPRYVLESISGRD